MLSGRHGDASMLNVEVQQQVPHDASMIASLTTSAASAPTIMDHFKQQQQRLASDRYDEKKEDYPSTNHHNTSFAPSPTKLLSLYSSQNDNGDSHHAYENSILSSGSMEDDKEHSEEEDDDDDMNVNFIKTTMDDSSSSPQRSINKAKNPNHTNSPTAYNRITLNTHNSILSISDDEDEEGETTTVNNCTLQNNTTKCAPEKAVPDRLPLQVPCHQRTSPSSCLMDNDVEEDDDDDDDDEDSDYEDDDANAEQRDGSFASLDLGGVDANVTTNGCSEHHAEKQDGYSTKNHQVPLSSSSSSSSIENNGRSSPTQTTSAPTTANNTTPCRPQKATCSSCIPQTPPICTRSWCGESATITTTPAAVMVVKTSPVLVAMPSIPIPQLPSSATTDATQQTPPLLPPHPCPNTSTSTSQVLMTSPRGGRGFFATMTEHFVDTLCFPRDDSPQRTCSSASIGVGATAAATTASTATTANSQSPPPQEQCSTPSSSGGGGGAAAAAAAAMHTARNLSGSTAATSDVIAATDTSTNSTADPPTSTSNNAICGSGGGGTSSSSWTSPLFGTTSANTNSGSSDDQRSLCLHDDIMVLLGCANIPNDDEMQKVWAWNQFVLECPQKDAASSSFDDDSLFHPVSRVATCGNPSLEQNYNSHQQYQYHGGRRRPRRRELHERAIRVHQLRTERGMPCYNKKPFFGRTKQMFTRPPVLTAATKMIRSTSSTTTTTTSPTSVTVANSQMNYRSSSSSRYQQQQQQQQENTHYGNLPNMMMDDSNLFAAEYHNSHCSTRRVGTDGNNNGNNIMTSSLPLRRSSRSMDDRILQQECKNDPLRKSKLEEHLNRRIGIGKNGSSTTTGPRARAASSILYQEEDEDDIGYDSDPGGLDIFTTATANTTTTTPAATRQQHEVIQNKTHQQRMVETTSGLSSSTSSSNNSLLGQPAPPAPQPPLWDANVIETVQESLNMSWNITWHPGNNFDANGNNNNSRKIRIWIERGTIINSAKVMLEPNIIWRDCYQPEMSKQRKLNVCTQKSSHAQAASASIPAVVKPFTIRLLSVCRVLEAPLHDALDRSLYPLARPSCSFLLKTAAPDGKEYLFEAATTAERDAIVHRWKVCIARFAALAVMEDLDAICREFFSPAISSLVQDNYYHW